MIVDLIPNDSARRDLDGLYKQNRGLWAWSVAAHAAFIFLATQIELTPASRRPIFDVFIRPLERNVLVYRPPAKKAEATPETRVGKSAEARGKIASPRTAIATAPEAKSQQQIVWKPVDLPEMQVDVPSPDLIARVETALPPPPKIAPKQFAAPPVAPKNGPREVEIASALPAAAVAQERAALLPKGLLPPPPKIAPKQFVPPASKREPKLALRTEVDVNLAQAPVSAVAQKGLTPLAAALPPPPKTAPKQFTLPGATGKSGQRPAQTEVAANLEAVQVAAVSPTAGPQTTALPPPPKTAPKQFTAPTGSTRQAKQAARPEITAALSSSVAQDGAGLVSPEFSRLAALPRDLPAAPPARGNDQANIAVASVNPSPSGTVPPSSRSGEFSMAPKTGEPSSGTPAPSAVVVPNLTVRDPEPPSKPKPEPPKSNTVIYAERVRAGASGTFTVPLRPSNRSIPRAIDARFPGRNVYTVLIPIENLPAYGGDWILWFAEVEPLPGQTPSVRAPVPVRKLEVPEANRDTKDTRLQLSATLGVDGKWSAVTVISNVPAEQQEWALEDLQAWEWKAATRNGVPIAIDAIIEIPFRFAQHAK